MTFKKGRIYVRLENGKPKLFFFPNFDVPEKYTTFNCTNVARMKEFEVGEPYLGQSVEFNHSGDKSAAGVDVTFRGASDEDLKTLFKSWNTSNSILDWLSKLEATRDIDPSELSRIYALAQPFLTEDEHAIIKEFGT